MSKYTITDKKGNHLVLHDIDNYQRAMQIIRNISSKVNSLEGNIEKEKVKELMRDLSQAVLNVAKEIYEPIVDQEKKSAAILRKNDYKTDFEGMQNISDLFE